MHNRVRTLSIKREKPFLDFIHSNKVKSEIDRFIDHKIAEWKSSVPYASHLEGSEINMAYYKRTLIEHSWRIRLMRSAQCHILYKISKINAEVAKIYANYQSEEMLHDTLFMQDAEKAGITRDEIYNTEPMLSTKLLIGFMYYIAEHENPLGALCYSYLVEYTSQAITPKQMTALTDVLG